MTESAHRIRSQTLDVAVATEALALALQPRLGELNRQRLLPVIDRVLGEFDLPGRHVRIDRLAIDLGTLPLQALEERAETALESALRDAIAAAITVERPSDAAAAQVLPEAEARLALLEHYLRHGTVPFSADRAAFSADALVTELSAAEPEALAALIRSHGRDRHVLQRLVLQLKDATLRAILTLIEPAHAALIIVYMFDLRQIHEVEPILPLDDAALGQLLWLLAFSYLLREAGSHFNRKSFVRALLEQIAANESVPYATLIATLARGLRATLRKRPLASSLPAVIDDIAHDLEEAPENLTVAGAADPAMLADLIRRHGGDRTALERLVGGLDETTLMAVLTLLEPVYAAPILAYMLELRQIQSVSPFLALGEAEFARMLWVLSFAYLAHDAGSQFNRRSYVRSLLTQLAARESVSFDALLAALKQGLQAAKSHQPLTASLPAIIDEIVNDLGSDRAAPNLESATQDRALGNPATRDLAALADLARQHRHDQPALERLVRGLDEATLQAVLAQFEPDAAAPIIAFMRALRQIHRITPLTVLDEAAFARILWVLALAHLAGDASAPIDPGRSARILLQNLAADQSMAAGTLAARIARAQVENGPAETISSTLAEVVAEILHEHGYDRGVPGGAGVPDDGVVVRARAGPAMVADLVRRHAGDPQALDRLVREFDENTLQMTLQRLEPGHAPLVIAYMLELRQIHRVTPLAAVADATLARLLWTLTFAYLARDAGSPFDRKSYLRVMLSKIASSLSTDLRGLTAILVSGLRAGEQGHPLAASLPAMIGEIQQELANGEPGDILATDSGPPTVFDHVALADLLRRERASGDLIARIHDESVLQAVLRELVPREADLIVTFIAELRRADGREPLTGRDAPTFARALWSHVLTRAADQSGMPFSPERFVRTILAGIADAAALRLDGLLAKLARNLSPSEQGGVPFLPEIVADLLQEVANAAHSPKPSPARDPPPRQRGDTMHPTVLRVLDRYDRIDALGRFLRHGHLPPDVLLRRGDLTTERLAEEFASLDAARIHALLATESVEVRYGMLLRAVGMLGPIRLGLLWRRLLAQPAEARDGAARSDARPDRALLEQALAAAVAQAPDPDAFHARLLSALIDGGEIDLEALAAPLLAPAQGELSTKDDSAAWPVRRLEAELLVQLRDAEPSTTPAATAPVAAPGLAELIEMLSSRHPQEAARFFRAVADSEALGPTLAARLDGVPEVLRQTVERLAGAEPDDTGTARSSVFARDALFAGLGDAATLQPLTEEQLQSTLPAVAAAFPEELAGFIAAHAGRAELRARWIATLADSALVRLAHALEPHQFVHFLDAAEMVHRAAFAIADPAARGRLRRTSLWEALLGYLATNAPAERSTEDFVAILLARAGEEGERIRTEARRLAAAAGRHRLVAALAPRPPQESTLHRRPASTPSGTAQSKRPRPARARTAFGIDNEATESGEPIYIDNAGMALFGVFLPQLFDRLDALSREQGRARMRDEHAASRAVHLLQYLVDGRCNAPEPLLVLNKLFCGLSIATPVPAEITPTADELALCDGLLQAMIANWKIIENSSVAALRETFLQREGKLEHRSDRWTLHVQRKTVDVLVDRIPWSISVTYHPWMPLPLYVTW
jgi:hypothetical protein